MVATSTPDLDAYFGRIGYAGSREPTLETLNGITKGHVCSIPFENIDVLLGRGIDLDPAAVETKLVRRRRGGYCFEQNGLLLSVLSTLGFRVTPFSARVGFQVPRTSIPPRTHVFLRVDIQGGAWLADVGIGGFSVPCAISLDHEREQPAGCEPRRIVRQDGCWFHQIRIGDEWSDLCRFTGEDMPLIDRKLANWWTSTHSESKFRQDIMVSRAEPDGARKTIQNREFTHRRGATIIAKQEIHRHDELLALLAEHFDLQFPASTRISASNLRWPD
jgi:N-hydroxyarylamine O-acetyltransferase